MYPSLNPYEELEDIAFEDCETCKGRFTCHLRSYCIQEEHYDVE